MWPMAIVARKIKKNDKKPKTPDLTSSVVSAVVVCAFGALASDGEVDDAELETLRGIISSGFETMLGKTISDDEVEQVIDRAHSALEELGYEAMMASAAEILAAAPAAKETALTFAALVIMSDGDFSLEGSEAEYYDDLAVQLEVDEQQAADIWNEMSERVSE
jgi:hypothetical protein